MKNVYIKMIRFLFNVGSFLMPRTTGLLAFKLFCSPPKIQPKNKNTIARIKNGERILSKGERVTIDFASGSIAAYQFNRTASKSIILVHGFQSRATYMTGFIEPLVQQGYGVLAFDLPGHGLSSGKLCHVPIAAEALDAVYQHLGTCHAIISHSLGCVVTTTLLSGTLPALSIPRPASKLVLISSPNSVPRLFQEYVDLIGLKGRAVKVYFSMINKLSGKQPEDFFTANQLNAIGVPSLLIHSPEDREVPFSDAEEIVANNPLAELKVAKGEGHRRIIWSEKTINDAVKFVST